jgi:hypothetical protein
MTVALAHTLSIDYGYSRKFGCIGSSKIGQKFESYASFVILPAVMQPWLHNLNRLIT